MGFVTNNYLEAKIPAPSKDKVVTTMFRRAFIGLCSSDISDVVSNSIRVVKTKKQTSKIALSYMGTISTIVAEDGVQGLFLRGLGTKLITNGVSAMLFSILWKYFEQKLSAPAEAAPARCIRAPRSRSWRRRERDSFSGEKRERTVRGERIMRYVHSTSHNATAVPWSWRRSFVHLRRPKTIHIHSEKKK